MQTRDRDHGRGGGLRSTYCSTLVDVEQIAIRTLNQDTAGVLARVERGETVEITNRGRPIARIVPVTADPVAALIATGAIVPSSVVGPIPLPTVPAVGPDAGELISGLRDEERW
jgi:prevent-host-death family protein